MGSAMLHFPMFQGLFKHSLFFSDVKIKDSGQEHATTSENWSVVTE